MWHKPHNKFVVGKKKERILSERVLNDMRRNLKLPLDSEDTISTGPARSFGLADVPIRGRKAKERTNYAAPDADGSVHGHCGDAAECCRYGSFHDFIASPRNSRAASRRVVPRQTAAAFDDGLSVGG